MKDKRNIQKKFIGIIAETIAEFGMLEKNEAVLAAVSGGPDSVALILSLLALKKERPVKIGIIHLNHMLRGEESLRDEQFVKDLAARLALPFYGKQKDINAYAKKQRLSIEEAGREARYAFFNRTGKTHGYTKIATGHTKNDNAELVLMNLLRGTGPKGLSGIPPVRNNQYIRPLIRVSKKQIFEFLKAENQTFMFDSSNTDMAYLRNRIRHRLVPHLQTEYNPEIIDVLDRLSSILKQENTFLENETQKAFQNSLIKIENHIVILSKQQMSNLHPTLLNRVLRQAIRVIKKDLKRISFAHINDIIKFSFHHPTGASLDLPGQIRIYKDKETILIKKEKNALRDIGRKEKHLRQMSKTKLGEES